MTYTHIYDTQVIAKAKTEGDIRHPPPLEVARAESGALAVEAKASSINETRQNYREDPSHHRRPLYVRTVHTASAGEYKI